MQLNLITISIIVIPVENKTTSMGLCNMSKKDVVIFLMPIINKQMMICLYLFE
jgi:hypothetical protein